MSWKINVKRTHSGGSGRFEFRLVCYNGPETCENKSKLDGPGRLHFKVIWINQDLKGG